MKEAQLQANPWQESYTFPFFFVVLFRTGGTEMETTCPSQTQEGVPSWFRRLE